MTTLEYFDYYAKMGLQVIPLFPDSKIPVWPRWNDDWDQGRCRGYFQANPTSNMGLLLGRLVDVEGDTEEADDVIKKLIGTYSHPFWRSSKSTHHLFLNPDPRLTSTRFLGIEFRAHRHQSVLPPSTHEMGHKYQWGHLDFPIPEMPADLLEYYQANRPRHKGRRHRRQDRAGFIKTTCNVCRCREAIHKKRLILEVKAFRELGLLWQCHKCRIVDVRPACRRIRSTLRAVLPVTIAQPGCQKYRGGYNVLVG